VSTIAVVAASRIWIRPALPRIGAIPNVRRIGTSIGTMSFWQRARDAIERIYRARGMKKNQRLALICPDLSTASEFGMFSQTAFRLAQRIFPGPYTLVVPW